MKFTNIEIKNYRNFESVETVLDNKNVVFGLNDSGKTNFLTAIRTVLDYRFRNNISENDFFELNTQNVIRIKISLEIDLDNEDSQHLISAMKGARTDNGESKHVYVLLVSTWDDQNMIANTEIFWGNDMDDTKLIQVPGVGLNRTQIDSIFDVVYLDSLTDGGKSFNTYRRGIDASKSTDDENVTKQISDKFSEINHLIASTNVIQNAQDILTEEYTRLRQEHANVIIRSEQTMSGFTNNLAPYISVGSDGSAYPAGGDGRKKILSYAVQNALVTQRQNQRSKITVFLIEEPENSLHKGLQKSLSRRLFDEDIYQYFFMTTHSSEIISEMDRTMLIRISDKQMKGTVYRVPDNFRNIRKGYNAPVAEALFYDKVLIVEGPSEKLLIDAIGESLNLFPEENGKFVMIAFGVGMKNFFDLLSELGIKVLVRTDNDVMPNQVGEKLYAFPGMKRLINLYKGELKLSNDWSGKHSFENECNDLKELKKAVYDTTDTKTLAANNLFLAKDDLENDMWSVSKMEIEQDIQGTDDINENNFVKWLQRYKSLRMLRYTEVMSQKTAQQLLEGLDGLQEFFNNER